MNSQKVGEYKHLKMIKELNLEHHIADIETVTIHGTHKKNASMIVKTLDKEAIARNSTENLGNILSNISGVGALKTGNNIAKPISISDIFLRVGLDFNPIMYKTMPIPRAIDDNILTSKDTN